MAELGALDRDDPTQPYSNTGLLFISFSSRYRKICCLEKPASNLRTYCVSRLLFCFTAFTTCNQSQLMFAIPCTTQANTQSKQNYKTQRITQPTDHPNLSSLLKPNKKQPQKQPGHGAVVFGSRQIPQGSQSKGLDSRMVLMQTETG